MDPLTILKWIQFIEAEEPSVAALLKDIFSRGKSITQYLAEATANNADTTAAANAQIAADLAEIAPRPKV